MFITVWFSDSAQRLASLSRTNARTGTRTHTRRWASRLAALFVAFGIGGAAVVSVAETPVPPLQLTGYQLQLGETQRSFIRYIDLTFNSPTGLADLVRNRRLIITRQNLLNTRTNNINDLDPTEYGVNLTLLDSVTGPNKLRIDFRSFGIGGAPTSPGGDGYYRLKLDGDGDGVYETVKTFYRLLGDGNADRVVTSAIDKNYDLNGDGNINITDVMQANIRNGRRIASADVLPEDPNMIPSP